ncbi:hypothetical protein HARCEL1_11815 [Halococcoides cellulosivorans]|uniref:Halobacterial output domain-containing protein n=1 Tax=Halococcoides cellulosivorans TaxID=1679096 RepID=A0A2R4X4K1_9EURY|nr:hypothetical protein HARCEL1_11815 [Halococcoides cellulosivorans]
MAPSTAVVETVAYATDRDPTTLDPLYEAIDPDALDRLIRSSADRSAEAVVRFSYLDCTITVRADGTVVVDR